MNRSKLVIANPSAYAVAHMPARCVVDPSPVWFNNSGYATESVGQRMAGQGYCYSPVTVRLTAPLWVGNSPEEQRMNRIRAFGAGREMMEKQALENSFSSRPARQLGPVYSFWTK